MQKSIKNLSDEKKILNIFEVEGVCVSLTSQSLKMIGFHAPLL